MSTTKRKPKSTRRTGANIPTVNGDDTDVVDLMEGEQQQQSYIPPGLTSTTTPAGIARIDPSARAAAAEANNAVLVTEIPIARIAASPFQPRLDPGEAKIAGLAAAIRDWGFKGHITVRQIEMGRSLIGGGAACFELIDGERRLRAAHAAGLKSIPAIVEPLDDSTAEERVLLANEGREDLTPLERGRVIKRLLERGLTQQQVAARLGCTQGAISNKVRILELPAQWLDGTIHPELSRSEAHLREVAAYRHNPALLQIIAEWLQEDGNELPPVRYFGDDLNQVLWNATEELPGTRWISELGRNLSPPKLTAEQLERLGIVQLRCPWGDKRTHDRVTNTEALKEIWDAHIAKAKERDAKKAGKGAQGKPGQPELSAAEQAKRGKEKAEQFARRLYAVKLDWLQYAIATELEMQTYRHEPRIDRIVLYLATSRPMSYSGMARENVGRLAITEVVPTAKPKKSGYGLETWPLLAALADPPDKQREQVRTAMLEFVLGSLWLDEGQAKQAHRDPGAQNLLPPGVIEDLAAEMEIDLVTYWQAEMMGPLTRRYFAIHSREQLAALAKELKCTLPDGTKSQQIEHLMAQRPQRMPQEIIKAKGGER